MSAKSKYIIAVIIVAILCAGAFYAGMQYGSGGGSANNPRNIGAMRGQQFGPLGGGQRGAVRANGGFAGGEIISKDDKSITVKMQDGGSKIIFLSGATQISKTVSGTVNDLSVGTQIAAAGSQNSDGSISAQSIQIRPLPPVVKQ